MGPMERSNLLFADRYSHGMLTQFIGAKDYATKADQFIKTIISPDPQNPPHEISGAYLIWKTKELPLNAIKGDPVDTIRMLALFSGRGLAEFTFNSGKCRYSICHLSTLLRLERTDYTQIIVTQNAVVPCSDIIIFGQNQFMYRLSVEGHREVQELDQFLERLKVGILER